MTEYRLTQEEWQNVLDETTIDGVDFGVSITSTPVPILTYPNPILTKISEPVLQEEFGTHELALLCETMHSTMVQNYGVGLSAVQIGELKRVITMRIPEPLSVYDNGYDVSRPYNFINPEILERYGTFKYQEGCLSVPGYYEDRERAAGIILRFQTIHGDQLEEEFSGLEAFCIQHEIDHLDGKLFIDDLSPLKKDRVRKKIQKTLKHK